jgi:hypothetical protein
MNTRPVRQLVFDSPYWYRIRVSGTLGIEWGERLMGLVIRCVHTKGEPPTTILEGELADQAALMGVLQALHDLQLPLLSVTCSRKRGSHRLRRSFDD